MNHCCREIWDCLQQSWANCLPKRGWVRLLPSWDGTFALLGWQQIDTGANGYAPCPGRLWKIGIVAICDFVDQFEATEASEILQWGDSHANFGQLELVGLTCFWFGIKGCPRLHRKNVRNRFRCWTKQQECNNKTGPHDAWMGRRTLRGWLHSVNGFRPSGLGVGNQLTVLRFVQDYDRYRPISHTRRGLTSRLMQWTPMSSAHPANVRQTILFLWTIIQLPYGWPSDWL